MSGQEAGELPAQAERALRADARRNREALLVAAAAAFSTGGVEASLEEIARQAGVGIGTLYRHFPTRDALIEAVYRREMERLCDAADELLAELPPDQALAAWLERFVRYVPTKRGLSSAVKSIVGKDSELFSYAHARLSKATSSLLDAAIAAGTIRADIEPFDLMRAVSGICMAGSASYDDQAARLVGLLMDGLRYRADPAVIRSDER